MYMNGQPNKKIQSDFQHGQTRCHTQPLGIPVDLYPLKPLVLSFVLLTVNLTIMKYFIVTLACTSLHLSEVEKFFPCSSIHLFPPLRHDCCHIFAHFFSSSYGFVGVLYVFWILFLCLLYIFQMSSCFL